MSIGGLMRTSVSGMAAQSTRLGTVAGNIANVSTVGYKSARAEFASLLLDAPNSTYLSGGVEARTRYDISRQGALERSNSKMDLAVSGNGFFLVQDRNGSVSLTRAGSFVPDANGELINAGGFKLLGMPAANGSVPPVTVNGVAGLVPISLAGNELKAIPTTAGRLVVNLPADATAVAAGDLPSANSVTSASTARSSVVVYGDLGEEVTLDVHYSRTATPGEWEVSIFNAADRSATGGFPYGAGAITTATLLFDANGQLDPSSVSGIDLPMTAGTTIRLDLEGTSQLATGYTVLDIEANGNPPAAPISADIGPDGMMYAVYANGARAAVYQIPLATVASPDNLNALSGNVFQLSAGSGDMKVGLPASDSFGGIVSGALEASTVDLASELTDMVEAQRNYTANSRVFQTGSELMDVLVNLKR